MHGLSVLQTDSPSTKDNEDLTEEVTEENAVEVSLDSTANQDEVEEKSVGDTETKESDAVDEENQDTKLNDDDDHPTWERICQEIRASDPDSLSYKNLKEFEKYETINSAACDKLHLVYDQVEACLTKLFNDDFGKALSKVHEELFSHADALESSIATTMGENHEKRTQLINQLEIMNKKWNHKCNATYLRIIGDEEAAQEKLEDVPMNETGENGSDTPPDNKEPLKDANQETKKQEDEESAPYEDPNWDELRGHSPEKVDAFLKARDRWQNAHLVFTQVLDEVHSNLERVQAQMLASVQEAYRMMSNEDMEADLQEIMAANFKRREALEKMITDAAKQHQKYFSSLYTRVGNSMMTAMLNIGFGKKKESPKKNQAHNTSA